MFGRRQTILAAVLALVPVLGGCDDDGAASGPASLVPPESPFYFESVVRPDGERAEAIAAIAESVAGIDDPGARIIELLDAQLAEDAPSLTYADDIEPWLGEHAALFVRSLEPASFAGGMADGAFVVEITDAEAARAFVDGLPDVDPSIELQQRSYEDLDYLYDPDSESAIGIVGDFMVAGTEAALKATADASKGDSLADSDDFSQHVGGLDEPDLAQIWVDLGTALDAAAQSSGADGAEIDAARAALAPLLEEPIAISLAATAESVTLDTSAAGGTGIGGNTELLGGMPADAWLAIAISGAGDALRETLSGIGSLGSQLGDPSLDPEAASRALEARTGLDLEEDLLAWLGDAALYVAGTSESEIAFGAVLDTSDADASASAIEVARNTFEEEAGRPAGPPRLEGAEEGFAALGPTGQGAELALRDGKVIAALGGANPAADVLEPAQTLAGSESFDHAVEALGEGYEATAYLALQDFLVVAEKGDDDGDPDYDAARPYLDALDYLIFGTDGDGDRDLARAVLGIGE